MKLHISKDGKTQYGENYKHLADQTIEMPEPTPGENETYSLAKDSTGNWVWEYRDNRTEEQKKIDNLQATVDQLVLDSLL